MSIILATWEANIGRIRVQGQPTQIVLKILSPKTAGPKWTGGTAKVVECLLCKCEELSSNTNPTQKINNIYKGYR
jgi:hypothetical protein